MIQAGELKHYAVTQQYTETRTASGGVTKTWATVDSTWHSIKPLSGKEFIAAQQSNAEVTHTIRRRYTPGITPKMRLLYGTRIFEYLAVMNWGENNEELRIMAKEVL